MNWCERKVMERVSMFLSSDGVFLKSICPNPATYPNEAAAIFHSGVSNAPTAFDGPTGRVSLPIALRTDAKGVTTLGDVADVEPMGRTRYNQAYEILK
jgi:hypothetical protein